MVLALDRPGASCSASPAVDPVKVTEYSIVLSAAALPLTYFPILVDRQRPRYMGDNTNGRFLNALAIRVPRHLLVVVALATIPLMIITKAGAESTRTAASSDAGLHLLDRQIIDRDGRLCGKVDDLELTLDETGDGRRR